MANVAVHPLQIEALNRNNTPSETIFYDAQTYETPSEESDDNSEPLDATCSNDSSVTSQTSENNDVNISLKTGIETKSYNFIKPSCKPSPKPRTINRRHHPYQNLPDLRVKRCTAPPPEKTVSKSKCISPEEHQYEYLNLWPELRDRLFKNILLDKSGYVQMTSPFAKRKNETCPQEESQKPEFCPFCGRNFMLKQLLFNHLELLHSEDIDEAIKAKEEYTLFPCTECPSEFADSRLLSMHLIEYHQTHLIDTLIKHNKVEKRQTILVCLTCKNIVAKTDNSQVLISHLVTSHRDVYGSFIEELHPPHYKNLSLLSELPSRKYNTNVTNASNDNAFKLLQIDSLTSLDSTYSNYSHLGMETISAGSDDPRIIKGILRNSNMSNRSSVKRELRFNFTQPSTSLESIDQTINNNLPPIYMNVPLLPEKQCGPEDISPVEDEQEGRRLSKKRKLSSVFRPRRSKKFKPSYENLNKENIDNLCNGKGSNEGIQIFRKPKSFSESYLHQSKEVKRQTSFDGANLCCNIGKIVSSETLDSGSPFSKIHIYSRLKMFKCSDCRKCFLDNDSLVKHLSVRHRKIFGLLKAQFSCGVCSESFSENRLLVKHCIQNHPSYIESRSPYKNYIQIYKSQQTTAL